MNTYYVGQFDHIRKIIIENTTMHFYYENDSVEHSRMSIIYKDKNLFYKFLNYYRGYGVTIEYAKPKS